MKKILVVVSLISTLLLAGCNNNEKVNNDIDNDVPENVTENQQQGVVDNNVNESSIDESIEDEYYFARSRGTVETVLDNDKVIVRSIVFLNSDGILAYNEPDDEELENLYYKYNGQVNLRDENGKTLVEVFGGNFGLCSLKDNVLSIVVSIVDIPGFHYEVRNIDIESREILDNEDIIKIAGRDPEQVKEEIHQVEYNLTKEVCDNKRLEYQAEFGQSEYEELLNEQLTSILKDVEDNFNFNEVELYFNEQGNLSFNSRMFSGAIAGIGEVSYLYDLESNRIIEKETLE